MGNKYFFSSYFEHFFLKKENILSSKVKCIFDKLFLWYSVHILSIFFFKKKENILSSKVKCIFDKLILKIIDTLLVM